MMNLRLAQLVLFLFMLINGLTAQLEWTLQQPQPSHYFATDLAFVNDQRGFIINPRQLLRTEDAGENWSVDEMMIEPRDIEFLENTGFIVGGYGLVRKSTDGGESWQSVSLNQADYFDVQIISPDTVLVISINHFLRSYDGGENWSTFNFPNWKNAKSGDFKNGQVGVVGCYDGTILKTIDGGENWFATVTTNTFPSDYENITYVGECTFIATQQHNDLYKSTDCGESWEENEDVADLLLTQYWLTENLGYAAGEYGIIMKSDDGGDDWELGSLLGVRKYATTITGLHFFDENHGIAAGNRGRISRTYDGGENWEHYAPFYDDVTQITYPENEQTGYALIQYEVFKTTDGGANWSSQGLIIPEEKTRQLFFLNNQLGYSISGGSTNSSAASGMVMKTTNGGQSWLPTNGGNPLIGNDLRSIWFIENVGYVSGGFNDRGLFKTTNGGGSWTQLSELSFSKMKFVTTEVGYAISSVGHPDEILYRTTDGGVSWDSLFEAPERIIDFEPSANGRIAVVGRYGGMSITYDGGENWQEMDLPYGEYLQVRFMDDSTGFVLEEDGEVLKTENGGNSWTDFPTIYGLRQLELAGETLKTAGVFGRMFTTNLTPVSTRETPDNVSLDFTVFPNPTESHNCYVENNDFGQGTGLWVYDKVGRLITHRTINVGRSKVFERDVTPGVYFIKLVDQSGNSVTKPVVIR